MSQTKSLPLKIETETPQFTMVSTAVEIKEMELEESFLICQICHQRRVHTKSQEPKFMVFLYWCRVR